MDIIEHIAQNRIQEAIENGDFKDLTGIGKPVSLREYFKQPPHLRPVYTLLKNAGMLSLNQQDEK